jgi:hypothetical protein
MTLETASLSGPNRKTTQTGNPCDDLQFQHAQKQERLKQERACQEAQLSGVMEYLYG